MTPNGTTPVQGAGAVDMKGYVNHSSPNNEHYVIKEPNSLAEVLLSSQYIFSRSLVFDKCGRYQVPLRGEVFFSPSLLILHDIHITPELYLYTVPVSTYWHWQLYCLTGKLKFTESFSIIVGWYTVPLRGGRFPPELASS